jgi:hypothetical protein
MASEVECGRARPHNRRRDAGATLAGIFWQIYAK